MIIHFDKTLMVFFFLVAMSGGLGAASAFDGALGLKATMIFGGVAGVVFILMHAFTALLFARSDARKALSSRRTTRKDKQIALRDKILKAQRMQLISASDTQHLKPWMGIFMEGGIRNVDSLRMHLHAAGYKGKNAIIGYCIVRFVATIAGFIAGRALASMIIGDSSLVVLCGGVAVAAMSWFFVPSTLTQRASARGKVVGAGMADAVDILKIYIKAGAHFDTAVVDMVPNLRNISLPVSEELDTLAQELRMTQDRPAAWDRFVARADSEPVREFAAIMKQSEEDGTPKSAALERLSSTLRVERVREADRKAAKIPALLLGPQFMFGLPALIITILFSPLYEAFINISGFM